MRQRAGCKTRWMAGSSKAARYVPNDAMSKSSNELKQKRYGWVPVQFGWLLQSLTCTDEKSQTEKQCHSRRR
eukprot:scaffold14302_cov22-Tisochrysis_lutea.AAC.2